MEIEWRKINGWDGYEVSACGQVRSFKANSNKPYLMKAYVKRRGDKRGSDQGYLTVSLHRKELDGSLFKKKITVHRLVCLAFHDNPENKPHINHKDCNQHNNHKNNLEWCTPLENARHAHANGRSEEFLSKIRKVTQKEKQFIADNFEKIGAQRVAEELGISYTTVMKYCHKDKLATPTVHTKRVIDLNTQIIYRSPAELAEKIGMKLKELRRRLSDERPNDTPYRYIDWYGKITETKPFIKKPKYVTPRTVKPIAVFDMEWNELKRFQYVADAALFVNGTSDKINEFLKGKCEHHKFHKFKLLGADGNYIEPTPFISKRKPKVIKPKGEVSPPKTVEKYDMQGTLLETYGSVGLAAKSLGADKKQFRRQIGSSPTGYARGFNWKVID